MFSLALIASTLLFSLSTAKPVSQIYYPPSAICTELTIPITINTTILSWNATKWPADDFALTDFVSVAATRLSAHFPAPFGDPVPFTEKVEISASFCTPKAKNGHEKTVLLASHGLGFERGYWNSQIDPDEYNFVKFATEAGYSVFFYDRLGVGKSTKISGFVNQASIQIDILGQLASLLKAGKYTPSLGIPKSVALVGHSFGSFISNGLVATQPEAVDAAVLTGIGYVDNNPQVVLEAFNPRIGALQSPKKFGDRDAGYVTNVDVFANVNNFFKAPAYTPAAATFTENTKQPFAIAEMISLNFLNLESKNFTGPVMVLSGEFDFILCGGLCDGILEPASSNIFPNSRNVSTVSFPGVGHGINFHLGATGAYKIALDFLAANGF